MPSRHRDRHRLDRQARRPRVTFDQLHTFLAVAELEHVTAAAAALGQSQGTVSASLQRLEETLGLPLFNRVGRNIRLTDVGRALRQLAVRTLREAQSIEELAEGYLAFERGQVAIASGRVMGAHRLAGWLAPFIQAHPEVDVRIALLPLHETLERLDDGSTDIAITGADVRLPGVETLVLEETELVVVAAAAHPLTRSPDPWRELGRHRHLVHESGTATRQRSDRLVPSDASDALTLELEEGALLAALRAGMGYAVMPRSVVDADLAAGRLIALERQRRAAVRQRFTAARRRALYTPAVQAMWEHLQAIAIGPPTGTAAAPDGPPTASREPRRSRTLPARSRQPLDA